MVIKHFLDAESISENEKTHGLDFIKFTFKLEQTDSTQTNETIQLEIMVTVMKEIKRRPWIASREMCY